MKNLFFDIIIVRLIIKVNMKTKILKTIFCVFKIENHYKNHNFFEFLLKSRYTLYRFFNDILK